MKRWSIWWLLALIIALAIPLTCPAPLVYTPGVGWSYDSVGEGGKWQKTRAQDQLEVAKEAFAQERYGLALKSSRRLVKLWPLSDYAPEAQQLIAKCYQNKKWDERAFKEYQKVMTKYPTATNYDNLLEEQFGIANRFLGGQWFKIWGVIPFFPSMDKTVGMYEKIIGNGPFSEVGPQAQLNIGAAREKQKKYDLAVKAYLAAADRYQDRPEIASEALFKAGMAYYKQAKRAEYDQNAAGQAIATFTDFAALYPDDSRLEQTKTIILELKNEQARGHYEIAEYYVSKRKWDGALVYFNEVLLLAPDSSFATQAKEQIEKIQKKLQPTP